ncbi:hypothetical protein BTVI_22827 [Pitangus sulphuratus]|nr:hypothetical protein BTVI_22827 [Pitangus sulphuratus]
MQPVQATVPATPYYSQVLPSQTPVTKGVWTEILLLVNRLGSEGAGVWLGKDKADSSLPGVKQSTNTSQGFLVPVTSQLSSCHPTACQGQDFRTNPGWNPNICWAEATSRGRVTPGFALGCELTGATALKSVAPDSPAQPSRAFGHPGTVIHLTLFTRSPSG